MRTHSQLLPSRRVVLAAPLLLLALALAGCGGSSDSGASSSDVATGSGSRSGGGSASLSEPATASGSDARPAVQERKVVSTGSVSLTSKDVGGVRTAIDRVLTAYDGFVADEQTSSDRAGRPEHATVTVRVPSRDFDTVMGRLSRIGTLVDASRRAEDVTTQVIDVRQRISAQEAGLQRLRQLVTTSGSLKALLAVEQQITDRQAALDSLEQQRAYLADQTSLSTITVTVDRRGTPAASAPGGFLGGLHDGWTALVTVLGGLLRGTGAALPFVAVALVLWLPVRALVRRWRPTGARTAQP